MNKSINIYGLILGIIGIIILTKLSSHLTPYRLYFTFTSFLFEDESTLKWYSLLIKLMIPCAVGFLLIYIPIQYLRTSENNDKTKTSINYISNQSTQTARAVGFYSALLLAWPYITHWDMLMHPVYHHLKTPYMMVYFIYMISYAYFAELGVNLGSIAASKAMNNIEVKLDKKYMWIETIRTSFMGVVTSGIASYFATTLGTSS